MVPSPNLPTLDTATVYPGTCLLEGTLLSEGRGTARPFELVGAPWIEPYRWAGALSERGLPGVRFRPLWFQPVASKHAGVRCGGVQLHVTDREAFRPVATGVHLIETARRLVAGRVRRARPGRAPAGRAASQGPSTASTGAPGLRQRIDAGEGAEAIIASWDVAPFEVLRQRARLYE